MDVTAIPFNRFLGLRADGTALTLPADSNYQNHLGTVHAGAQFALAEAASGQWLLTRFGPEAAANVAVVRHADVKYRKPAVGALTARRTLPRKRRSASSIPSPAVAAPPSKSVFACSMPKRASPSKPPSNGSPSAFAPDRPLTP